MSSQLKLSMHPNADIRICHDGIQASGFMIYIQHGYIHVRAKSGEDRDPHRTTIVADAGIEVVK